MQIKMKVKLYDVSQRRMPKVTMRLSGFTSAKEAIPHIVVAIKKGLIKKDVGDIKDVIVTANGIVSISAERWSWFGFNTADIEKAMQH